MKSYTLKEFLKIGDCEEQKIVLGYDDRKPQEEQRVNFKDDIVKIKELFKNAFRLDYIVYFDGRFVDFPYDGYEFKDLKDEFYYNNGNSYLVFKDETGFEVAFKIKYLKDFKFRKVYRLVKKACDYTKSHPGVSKYKLY